MEMNNFKAASYHVSLVICTVQSEWVNTHQATTDCVYNCIPLDFGDTTTCTQLFTPRFQLSCL